MSGSIVSKNAIYYKDLPGGLLKSRIAELDRKKSGKADGVYGRNEAGSSKEFRRLSGEVNAHLGIISFTYETLYPNRYTFCVVDGKLIIDMTMDGLIEGKNRERLIIDKQKPGHISYVERRGYYNFVKKDGKAGERSPIDRTFSSHKIVTVRVTRKYAELAYQALEESIEAAESPEQKRRLEELKEDVRQVFVPAPVQDRAPFTAERIKTIWEARDVKILRPAPDRSK